MVYIVKSLGNLQGLLPTLLEPCFFIENRKQTHSRKYISISECVCQSLLNEEFMLILLGYERKS